MVVLMFPYSGSFRLPRAPNLPQLARLGEALGARGVGPPCSSTATVPAPPRSPRRWVVTAGATPVTSATVIGNRVARLSLLTLAFSEVGHRSFECPKKVGKKGKKG